MPISNELIADAENMTCYLVTAISNEIAFKLEQYTLTTARTGVGKPLSIAKAPELLTMAAIGGQTAGTIVYDYLTKIWNALPSASRNSVIWVVSERAAPNLDEWRGGFSGALLNLQAGQIPTVFRLPSGGRLSSAARSPPWGRSGASFCLTLCGMGLQPRPWRSR